MELNKFKIIQSERNLKLRAGDENGSCMLLVNINEHWRGQYKITIKCLHQLIPYLLFHNVNYI